MKNFVVASAVAIAVMTSSAQAADLEVQRELGLIVSGVVDKWAGVQFIDSEDFLSSGGGGEVEIRSLDYSDTVFASGGEGLLSLPLGDNISMQSDVKYEYNSTAFADDDSDIIGPRYHFQGTVHFSWRDPATGLFGVFGGAGGADFRGFDHDLHFVGGEAQFYMGDLTFYGQGGYIGFNSDFDVSTNFGLGAQSLSGLADGIFARGVVRWFPTPDSRLQLEGTYVKADYADSDLGDMEAFSVKARYDFVLGAMPIIGDLPVFIAYRGTFRDNCFVLSVNDESGSGDVDDHTIMVGTSYSFSVDRLTVDRQGATLGTPDFNHSCLGTALEFQDLE